MDQVLLADAPKETPASMQWFIKKFRCSTATRSKLILMLVCFATGYLLHYLVSRSNGKTEIIIRHQSFKFHELNEMLLVVLIFSSVNNTSRREILRDTWLSKLPARDEVKYYFVISEKNCDYSQKERLSDEQRRNQDMLIFSTVEDSFFALTPKLVASFGYIMNNTLGHTLRADPGKSFKSFKYVLKCDDDSFVRLDKIVDELKSRFSGSEGEKLYWGFFDGRARVKKTGKYKEDQWNICDYYIPYALGGGYILARPLVEFITRNADYLKMYKNEDVSVGAWLSSYSGLNRVHDPRFDTEYVSRGCHHSYLITHKHSEATIVNYYVNVIRMDQPCLKEFKTRMSYNYNWDVEPSKCCPRDNPDIP